jgi:ATP-dependent RNA helicase RhlE
VSIQRERTASPPSGITQAVYPVPQELKSALLVALLRRGDIRQALVFTRTKHRANRLAELLVREGVQAGRIHGNRSQAQRTTALESFRAGRTPVLVATDIAARGIDIDALSHVVNFDVPLVPEDYIHRVGRTGRAEATGDAFTFMAPEERSDLAAIERALGRPLARVTVPDFDYAARPPAKLEVPIAQRVAEIRARKAADRARSDFRRGRSGHAAGASHGAGGRPAPGPQRGPGGADSREAGGSRPSGRRWSFRPRRRPR